MSGSRIATHNGPMLTALGYCIEELERFRDDPHVATALQCARMAVEWELGWQTEHREDTA
jgi:hypothetical protein